MLDFHTKKSLRQYYRALRHQGTVNQKNSAAQSLSEIFLKNIAYAKKKIAVYVAWDSEIDLHVLIEQLWKADCQVFLPIIDVEKTSLNFIRYTPDTSMKKNQYGIDEPENRDNFISAKELDIVLMPVVAFDHKGIRLGMGKGYYDRSFSFCRTAVSKPLLIGAAYRCQQAESLPFDEWDITLDAIITENKLIGF